jgi:hypothetical protein
MVLPKGEDIIETLLTSTVTPLRKPKLVRKLALDNGWASHLRIYGMGRVIKVHSIR